MWRDRGDRGEVCTVYVVQTVEVCTVYVEKCPRKQFAIDIEAVMVLLSEILTEKGKGFKTHIAPPLCDPQTLKDELQRPNPR